jgi:hypothetical protein
MKDFVFEAQALRWSGTREGDAVLIDAPAGSMGVPYNGREGWIESIDERSGWIVVDFRLRESNEKARFRADELRVL